MTEPPRQVETDVVVVGSGAAGLTAALTARLRGCRVIIVEADRTVGGTTAWSGGAAWLPGNPHMASLGESDCIEAATAYVRQFLGNRFDDDLVSAFLTKAPEMVRFLERESSAVRFVAYPAPDYHPDLSGAASKGRSVIAAPFDGRLLGKWLRRMRGPMPELTVFGGMQVDPAEALHLQQSWKNPTSFKVAIRLLTRYAADRLRYGRTTRLIRGQALLARLLKSATDVGIDIRTSTRARQLMRSGTDVTGLVVQAEDGEYVISARRGVVLATGGFSNDAAMVAKHFPDPSSHIVMLPGTSRGDGLEMGREAGGTIDNDNSDNGIWMPASARYGEDGALIARYPHFSFDRCKPGSILVNGKGERFVDEASPYHPLVRSMRSNDAVPAWLVADHAFLRKYGMGMARPFPYPYRHLVREGYLKSAATIAKLAEQIGVPVHSLETSVAKMNAFAELGEDPDFGKGGNIFDRMLGDAAHRPNPCLGRIEKGPFYALALYPSDCGTTLGLRTDANAQVLTQEGRAIRGLYACGPDMNSVLKGNYPGAGTMIGPGMTFAYVAGTHLADRSREVAP